MMTTSQSVRALSGLRELVMGGSFEPGERLIEGKLCDELRVSRTPLREALIRLDADGLLVKRESGYFVVRYDLPALRDLYELRMVLELHGLQRAVEYKGVDLDVSIVESLRDSWRALLRSEPTPGPDLVRVDEDFHIGLSTASGNAALTEQLQSVNRRIRPLRMYDYSSEERVHATITEHLDIVEHVLSGDLVQAAFLLKQHVGDSLSEVEEKARLSLTNRALHLVG